MAVTWKALAYSSEVTSAVTSEGVVRSTADSSLTLAISGLPTSAAVSTADSKAVSAGSAASVADSKAVSEGVVRSSADSSLTVTVSTADSKAVSAASLASSQNTSQVTTISTADSKAVSAGTAASTADSKAVSLVTVVSTADSKAVSAGSLATSLVNSEGVVRSTADSSLTVKPFNQFGAATGPVSFAGQQAENFVIHTTATTASMTGLTAVVGKFAFCSADLSPYVCTVAV
jgi:hypothetical protein